MICPSCGTHNNAGAKFCQECATPLATNCPNCGTPASPGAKFCSNCATALTNTAPAATSAPENKGSTSERKLVTVLFAVAEVIRSTREILEGLRATPYVAILDQAAARKSPEPARKRPATTEVAVSG